MKQENNTEALGITSLVKAETPDIVPAFIDQKTAILANHSQEYLLKTCQEYQLTRRQLEGLIELKTEYRASLKILAEILAKEKYTIDEMNELLTARQMVTTKKDSPPLRTITDFYNQFDSVPLDGEYLGTVISSCHEQMGSRYVAATINLMIRKGKELCSNDPGLVLEYLLGGEQQQYEANEPGHGDEELG